MITEIKLDGLDNNPIKTNKKQPPQSKNKIYHLVILRQSL